MDTNEYIDALIKSARCEIQTREYCNTHICEECQFNDDNWFGNNNDLLHDMADMLEIAQKRFNDLNQSYQKNIQLIAEIKNLSSQIKVL